MNVKIEGWKVTIHNEKGDRLELKGEFEADFFKEYENKQLIIADVVGRSEQLVCTKCGSKTISSAIDSNNNGCNDCGYNWAN